MRITFLGTGSAFCDYRVNYQNNALIETSEGPVLIDCGTTACQSLAELGVDPTRIRAVVFTHLHADHASPEQLAWKRYYSGEPGTPLALRTPLVGPRDLIEPLLGALVPYMDEYTAPDGEVRRGGVAAMLDPRIAVEVEIGGVRFRWFRVPHVTGPGAEKPAYGLVIDDGDRRVWWSGDTTFSSNWVREAAGDPRVARIFHECIFHTLFRGTVHTHFSQMAALEPAVAERVTLMHHNEVPAGTELGAIAGAARRHEVFEL